MKVKKKLISMLGWFFSISILILALVILHFKIKQYSYAEISLAFHSISAQRIAWALILTIIGYVVMTFYDFMGIRYVGTRVKYPQIALASFISYSFSNNMGFPLLTGAIRYRLYSALKLGAFDIARIVAFCTLTLWLGYVFLTGIMLVVAPNPLPPGVHVPFLSLRLLGVIFLVSVAVYLVSLYLKRTELHIRQWVFKLPNPSLGFAQIAVSSLDWVLAGTVIYVLFPAGYQVHYFSFLSIFLIAQLLGNISQIPGGLGVFESVMLLLLKNSYPQPIIIGTLIAFRIIYYFGPLGLGTMLFAGLELNRQRKEVKEVFKFYDNIVGPLAPLIFATITFLSGLMLLFSGATPAIDLRLQAMHKIIPVPVMEVSHFLGSLIGIALLLLARGLQRRLNSAYFFTILAMSAAIVLSLLKGFDYEEAITLAIMLMALLPCHKHFYRHSRLIDQPVSFSWMLSIFVAVFSTIWLGYFSFKHVQYSHELWWKFGLHKDASRFLRMLVGIVGFLFLYSLFRLSNGFSTKYAKQADNDTIKRIIVQANKTHANLAFLGDKSFFVNKQQTALIMYAIEGSSWVSMGNPIGGKEDIEELAWQFREYSNRNGGKAVFYEVDTEYLDLYLDMGLSLIKIGESARVNLMDFDLEDSQNKRHRRTIRLAEASACSFDIISSQDLLAQIPRLKVISDGWLKGKHAKEKGFSLGYFDPQYLSLFPVGVVIKAGEIIAFANLWTTPSKAELSVDLMRYLPGIEENLMEYLFLKLMSWGKENGYQYFDLGMAPLSGLHDSALAPLWHRLGSLIFQYGDSGNHLQGLRQYKEKFNPSWEPMYIAAPGGFALPGVLMNLSNLISTGYKKKINK
ncbi:MAG: bifunctional lysylphosphatidylglycerol flippase/synthetase MprF [Candidatus Cloacimonetes bacterium]|jgi:phosphatidylglycerol lysyltransferase|nr:bifunctional lysylphosphatidylglycerol flippase/synthetase MprF [Candidatus Cloacimonadota bacterium]MDY0325820.1 bifunctional lysylphosphatidylglycerol flippase/synthetase MprF [Candidatus Cloacimonadaceae bacterium]